MKQGIRVLGIDDSSFDFDDEEAFLTGVVYRGKEFVEDIQSIGIEVDGLDATEKVLKLYGNVSNHHQLKAILIDGISLGGFNLVDIEEVSRETGKPVVAVTKNRPDRDDFRKTMERTDNYDERFEKLDDPVKIDLEDGSCFMQFSGCSREKAEKFVKGNLMHGQVPESIRVAHMVGRALNSRP